MCWYILHHETHIIMVRCSKFRASTLTLFLVLIIQIILWYTLHSAVNYADTYETESELKPGRNSIKLSDGHVLQTTLPTIYIREWKYHMYKQSSRIPNLAYSLIPDNFKPLINVDEYRLLLEIWNKFTVICNHNNITYVLDGGSLLGSYRHHGLVPWDDDIDVMISRDDVIKLLWILTTEHEYAFVPRKRALKFFKLQGNSVVRHSGFNWPFIDIFVFWQNRTHLWTGFDTVISEFPSFTWNTYEKFRYLPIKYRLFEDRLQPVPNDIVYALGQEGYYNTDSLCKSHLINHMLALDKNTTESLTCAELYRFYPFVKRTHNATHITEMLVLNGTVLCNYAYTIN